MRQSRLYGSVRGAVSDDRPYRDLDSGWGMRVIARSLTGSARNGRPGSV